jgi:tripartite-type tricarboxylate transporter receptor subunit TctC
MLYCAYFQKHSATALMNKYPTAAAAALLLTSITSLAQTYPSRPVRVVVPFTAGGPAEIIARLVGQKLTEQYQQQFIIDLRGGGGGTIGTDIVAKAAPDGYTLLLHTMGHVVAPGLYQKLPYDADKDFAPIAIANTTQLMLIAHTSVPAKSVQELIALARAKPRQLNFASSGSGGISHLAGHLFLTMTGIELTHVPYKGMGPALTDVVAGQLQMVFPDPAVALPHVRAGRVNALGVTSTKRVPSAPNVPTIAESGVPGYDVPVWYGYLAPRGTPRALVDKLHSGIAKAMANPELRERFTNDGGDVTVRGPEEFAAQIRKELPKWAKVVKDAGVRID